MNATRKCSGFTHYNQFDFNIDFTKRNLFVFQVIMCLANIVLTASTIALNSVTAICYWRSIQLRRKMSNFLIMVLSLSDLAVGMVPTPLFAFSLAMDLPLTKLRIPCFLDEHVLSLLIFSGCSFKTLVVMNVERYLGIIHPFVHKTKVTKGRLMKCLIMLWFVVAAVVGFTFYNEDVLYKFVTTEVFLVIGVLVYIYGKIYLASKTSFVNMNRTNRNGAQDTSQSKRKVFLSNLKLAKTNLIVFFCFFICFFPGCFFVSFASNPNDDAYIVSVFSYTLLLLNSSLNSLIFFWRNKSLREEAFAILKHAK